MDMSILATGGRMTMAMKMFGTLSLTCSQLSVFKRVMTRPPGHSHNLTTHSVTSSTPLTLNRIVLHTKCEHCIFKAHRMMV